MKYFYDFHLHSCLSPCGDSDMTPANIAAMCALAGLNIVALTDHNTCGNCAAFCSAAKKNGLLALPGMELCTREEVHVVCLFPSVESAMSFSSYVTERLPPIANKPELFGHQLLMDDQDAILKEEFHLLIGCADISIDEVPSLISSYGGFAFPAHIDRSAYSLISTLGFWNPDLDFPVAELSHQCPPEFLLRPDLQGLHFVVDSDAHYLDQIYDAEHWIELPELSADAVLSQLHSPSLSSGPMPGSP